MYNYRKVEAITNVSANGNPWVMSVFLGLYGSQGRLRGSLLALLGGGLWAWHLCGAHTGPWACCPRGGRYSATLS